MLRGGSLLAAGTLFERLARLARNILLARVIAPDQFGIMAIVLAIIALFDALMEVGITQAVIQNDRGHEPAFLNVAWWFSLLRGVVIILVALPFTPLIANFYQQPELAPLLLVALSSLLFTGATSPRIYALQREFRFGATLWTTQGAGLLATVFTLILGFYLQNVWALVLGTVFEAFARFVLSFILCPIRPSFRLDRGALGELFRFARGMAGIPILTFVLMQADIFVLGKVAPAEVVGFYSMAIVLAGFPLTIFSKVAQPMVVPVFAMYQHDQGALRSSYLRLSRLIWLYGLPMAATLATLAAPLLTVVYGAPYASVASSFGVYALYCVVYMSSMISFSVYLSIGRPGLQRSFTFVRAGMVAAAMYPAVLWLGPLGAALTLLTCLALAMLLQLYNLKRAIGLPPLAFFGTLGPGLVAAAAVSAATIPMLYIAAHPLVILALGALPLLASWALATRLEWRSLRDLRAAPGPSVPPDPDQTMV